MIPRKCGVALPPVHALACAPAIGLLSLISLAQAAAQTPAPMAEEITVTARKRAEPLYDVPASLLVVNETSLRGQRIESLEDLALAAPSLQLTDPFGRFNPSATIRGLSQEGIGDEPNVGFFLDGIYLSNRSSLNAAMVDVAQVELVRGPQSALYGRNSFGGAVNLVTRPPAAAWGGEVLARVGTDDLVHLRAHLDTPVARDLRGRFTVLRREEGGTFDNQTPGLGLDDERTTALASRWDWQPAEDVAIRLRLGWSRDEDSQPASHIVPPNCAPRLSDGALRYFCGTVPTREDGFASNPQQTGFTREGARAALQIDWALAPGWALASLTGAMQEQNRFDRDDDYSAVLAREAGQITHVSDLQQELRLNREGERWRGLIGASLYAFDIATDRRDINYALGATEPGGPLTDGRTRSAALFGSVEGEILRNLDVGIALRGLIERKEFDSTITDEAGQPLDLEESWTTVLPRFTLNWRPDADVQIFGAVGRGFKSGGFNSFANVFDSERVYEPDTNWTLEAGLRTRDAGGRWQLGVSAFWIDWQDQQVTAASARGTSNNFFVNNAGGARSAGFEIEGAWQPGEAFRFDLAYAFADAVFTDYRDPDLVDVAGFAPDGDVAGNQLPRHARHQLALSGQYRQILRQGWEVSTRLDGRYESPQYSTPANLADTGARLTLDGRLAWAGAGFEAALFVDNILDDDAADVAIRWFDPANGFARAWLVSPRDRRRYGLELSWRWAP